MTDCMSRVVTLETSSKHHVLSLSECFYSPSADPGHAGVLACHESVGVSVTQVLVRDTGVLVHDTHCVMDHDIGVLVHDTVCWSVTQCVST